MRLNVWIWCPGLVPLLEPLSLFPVYRARAVYEHQTVFSAHTQNGKLADREEVLDKLKLKPAGDARWKVKGSPKLLQFILWGPWMSEPNFIAIHPVVVEIGLFQSRPKWWTDQQTIPRATQLKCQHWLEVHFTLSPGTKKRMFFLFDSCHTACRISGISTLFLTL